MLPKISIKDSNFDRNSYKRLGDYFRWEWDLNVSPVVYTDRRFAEAMKDDVDVKIAWLVEPPIIIPAQYEFVEQHIGLFDLVLTFDYDLAQRYENASFYPLGGSWVFTEDRKIHQKSKLLSMVTSLKKNTIGQRKRIEIMDRYGSQMDLYGREFKPIDNKADGLGEYCFSFAIENSSLKYYFTEKLIDCFITGTVPIYWGCPEIEKFFNTDGMILIESIDEVGRIIEGLSFEKYNRMKDAVVENYKKALSYCSLENNLWNAGLKDFK